MIDLEKGSNDTYKQIEWNSKLGKINTIVVIISTFLFSFQLFIVFHEIKPIELDLILSGVFTFVEGLLLIYMLISIRIPEMTKILKYIMSYHMIVLLLRVVTLILCAVYGQKMDSLNIRPGNLVWLAFPLCVTTISILMLIIVGVLLYCVCIIPVSFVEFVICKLDK